MKILITGAGGSIGSTLVKGMEDKYSLRGLDRVAMPDLEDAIIGDITDLNTVLKATEAMDAIIHLAGIPDEAAWEQILSNNIIGTYHVFEAARRQGVRRLVFASRAGFLESYPKNIMRTIDLMPRPQNYYSISKVFGENLGYMYSTNYGLEFVAVRIGGLVDGQSGLKQPEHLTRSDAVRVFEQAVTHPGVKYEIVFGVSDSTWPLLDLEHGKKAIRYFPQDKFQGTPEV